MVEGCMGRHSGYHKGQINALYRYKLHYYTIQNGSVSSEELSDEDLDEICGSQEVARMLSHCTHEDLLVVGSKPKLHSMFEVPVPVIKPPAVSHRVCSVVFYHNYYNFIISSLSFHIVHENAFHI